MEQAITRKILFGHTVSVVHLSEAYLRAGQIDKATEVAQHAVHLACDYKERGNEAYALRLLGDIAAQREPPQVEAAEAHYRQALALAEELGMRPLQAHGHLGLGTLYAQIGQRQQARIALTAAISLYRAMDMTFWLPQAETALERVEG
jgi:tetratricopeptide (TPR) repeat protein